MIFFLCLPSSPLLRADESLIGSSLTCLCSTMLNSAQLSAWLKILISPWDSRLFRMSPAYLWPRFWWTSYISPPKSIQVQTNWTWVLHNGPYTCSPPFHAGFSFAFSVALLTFLAEILSSWKPSSNACSLMWPLLVLPGSCIHSLLTKLHPVFVVSVLVSSTLDGQILEDSFLPPSTFIPPLLVKK